MRYLVTRVYPPGPEMYDGAFSMCVVPLSRGYCKMVLAQHKLMAQARKADEDACSFGSLFIGGSWHDCAPYWYATTPEDWSDFTDDPDADAAFWDGYLVLGEDFFASLGEPERSECEHIEMIVACPGDPRVLWSAYPKHYSVREESVSVPLSVFADALDAATEAARS